jgi:hypothetical protein
MWRPSLAAVAATGMLLSAGGSSQVASGAGAKPSFPKSFTGVVTRHLDRTFDGGGDTEDWTATITFRRTQVYPSSAGYHGAALADGKMSGTFRTCRYGFGPLKLRVEGTIVIRAAHDSPTGFRYDLNGGGGPTTVPYREQCSTPGTPRTSTQVSFSWNSSSPSPVYRPPRLTGRIEGRQDGNHGVVTWNLVGQADESCDELKARASARTALRAARVMLDGSASTPKGCIRAYKWSFAPGANCRAAALKPSTKSGPTPTIVPLCSLGATLTVVGDNGKRATVSTEIRVLPREAGFRTPRVEHEEKREEDPRIDDPPFTHDGEDYGARNGGIVIGTNVSACRDGSRGPPFLCPDVGSGTGLGKRYTLATVHDPGGPFDGFSYVESAPLTIERLGILNYWFLPGGPPVAPGKRSFFDYNRLHGTDVRGFLTAASVHEGMGRPARLSTGHSGRLQAHISVPDREFDPRRILESRFGRARNRLRDDLDRELSDISVLLATATRDPLPEIWSGKLWLYDPELERWVKEDWKVGPSDKQ